jgi:hypothetical protein
MIANGPISSFVPIIISSFGFSTLNSLLLMMPFGFVTGTIEWIAPFIASKLPGSRTWIMFICQTGTTMSALLLWLLPPGATGGLLFGIYFLASLGGGYSILMGLQTVCKLFPSSENIRCARDTTDPFPNHFQANTAGQLPSVVHSAALLTHVGYTKKSLTASWVFLGFCFGNIVGPLLFKEEDAPGYEPGWIAVVITSIITSVLALVYRYLSMWENKRRDKAGIMEDYEHAYEDDLTDMKVLLHRRNNVRQDHTDIPL